LIGFGASAISALPQGYTQNAAATGAYMRAIDSGHLAVAKGVWLTTVDTLRRHLIERLMCDFRVDIQQSCERFGFAIDDLEAAINHLQPFLADGFATLSDNHLSITERGRPLTRAIASSFDAYLTNPERTHRHSTL
jgi:oxygen-independent coproporphyrinogen-3 oxidase